MFPKREDEVNDQVVIGITAYRARYLSLAIKRSLGGEEALKAVERNGDARFFEAETVQVEAVRR
jgi:hypothetical protein